MPAAFQPRACCQISLPLPSFSEVRHGGVLSPLRLCRNASRFSFNFLGAGLKKYHTYDTLSSLFEKNINFFSCLLRMVIHLWPAFPLYFLPIITGLPVLAQRLSGARCSKIMLSEVFLRILFIKNAVYSTSIYNIYIFSVFVKLILNKFIKYQYFQREAPKHLHRNTRNCASALKKGVMQYRFRHCILALRSDAEGLS